VLFLVLVLQMIFFFLLALYRRMVPVTFLLLKYQVFRKHNDIISIFLPSISAANDRRRHSFMVLSVTKLQLVVYR